MQGILGTWNPPFAQLYGEPAGTTSRESLPGKADFASITRFGKDCRADRALVQTRYRDDKQ